VRSITWCLGKSSITSGMNGPEKLSAKNGKITVGILNSFAAFAHNLDIVERDDPIVRLNALLHGRLVVAQRHRAIFRSQNFDL